MQNKAMTRIAVFVLAALFSLYIGLQLAPKTNPSLYGLPSVTDSDAELTARQFLEKANIDYKKYHEYSYYDVDQNGSNYVLDKLGLEKTREIMTKAELPLSYWTVQYVMNVPRNNQQDWLRLKVSPTGRLISYEHYVPDSMRAGDIDSVSALTIIHEYMKSWPGVSLDGFSIERTNSYKKPQRTDIQIIFSKPFPGLDRGAEKLNFYLAGKTITSVNYYFEEPSDANIEAVGGANIIFNALSIAVYFFVTLIGLVLFLKLYHDGQIGVRNAVIVGGIVYFAQVFYIINMWDIWGVGTNFGSISHIYTKWILLGVQMVIAYVYMFVNSFSTWAVSDYYLRTVKPALLKGTDSLFSGKLLSKNVGLEVPVGFAYGIILFGIVYTVNYLLIHFAGARPLMMDRFIGHGYPIFALLLAIFVYIAFEEVIFRKFYTTWLKTKIKSLTTVLFLSAFTYSFYSIFFNDIFKFWPAYYSLVPYFIIGLVQAWVFWKYGLLTAFTSAALFYGVNGLVYIFYTSNSVYYFQGGLIIAIFTAVFIAGVYSLLKGKVFEYNISSEPQHIKRIKERARMQQELEIAKKVQLGLLPKEQPQLKGFDITGVCLPALEVGGDYFDFINLQDGKLGIAIADVSGKGVPAAIYMTLTKGILQSHAEATLSPKSVLSKVNSLMYRTIERSWYVSMFYAVLDPSTKKLVFSRAGHNPAIVLNTAKKEHQLLQPAGIGLGLEMGDIFTKTLVEGELTLESGNTLVFYTDGFTEAMNEKEEEYGEERFLNFLSDNDNGSASELLNKAITEIKSFQGQASQHDDMTMVVLKVF
ncbi:MAG: SpoIIE family protein phosphatase [Calditrichae bacterium]|nr:SpoIIE family protein phosphatase [Calditrichota bacterium]MCB9059399.1 SpoIIE family protein phosphatase [Calditrichia bacterium]